MTSIPTDAQLDAEQTTTHQPEPVTSFKALNLSQPLLEALDAMGFSKPTGIQAAAIPALLEGRDVIGQAQTGSGKTAAFALPLIQQLEPNCQDVQGLILCPTRELVVQVAGQVNELLRFINGHHVVAVYGGEAIDKQLRQLKKKPSIVVGTPGRTMDLMERGALDLSEVRVAVLDEADEMLDMGFRDDMEDILSEASPEDRQTVLFSATMEADIMRLAKTYQREPLVINVSAEQRSQPKIEHYFSIVPEAYKMEAAFRFLAANSTQCGVVFCNTKARVDELVEFLRGKNLRADALHGDMNQNARTRIMHAFRAGFFNVLVATDVAGRGMDVNDLEVVINYDLPRDNEDYVHRVGRTGRAGKTGKAYTLVSHKQAFIMKKLARTYNLTIQPVPVPTAKVIDQLQAQGILGELEQRLAADRDSLVPAIQQLKRLTSQGVDAMEVAAALLNLLQENHRSGAEPELDSVFEVRPFNPKERSYDNRGPGGKGGGFKRGRSFGKAPRKKGFGSERSSNRPFND